MLIIGQGVVEWIAERIGDHGNFGPATRGIGWLNAGAIVAGVAYAEWNGRNVVCHIASDGSRRWATRAYLRTIFDYPFNQLAVERITCPVGEGNRESRRFVQHLGFTLETTLEQAHPTGDLLVYRMWKGDCKWISQDICKPLAKAA